MGRLLAFLFNNRSTLLFIVLQALSAWLLVSYNQRYNASFFNSSNFLAASVNDGSNQVSNYFRLEEINAQLLNENRRLREQLYNLSPDSSTVDTADHLLVMSAVVVDNTYRRAQNFFTISKGKKDGIERGMGVLSTTGVAGQVKAVSNQFATVYSVLHPSLSISSKLKKSGTVCSVQWDQRSFREAKLKYLPRHINLQKGDTVVTSGFNSIFPEDIFIGVIQDFELEDHMTFYDANITLATDFTSLHTVYIIKDALKEEKDSLSAL